MPPPVSLSYWVEIRPAVKPSLNSDLCASDSHLEKEGDRGHTPVAGRPREAEREREREGGRERERKRTSRGKS